MVERSPTKSHLKIDTVQRQPSLPFQSLGEGNSPSVSKLAFNSDRNLHTWENSHSSCQRCTLL